MLYARCVTILARYMEYRGIGFCDDGYYAGWDGKGEASVQDCKNLCMSEDQCTFAAYFNIGDRRTCSRYNKDTCNLDTTSLNAKNHTTFAKTGLLL